MSSDLSLEKHVSVVSAACFFYLRQIRRVRQSLDAESAATHVHAFVTSRVDYTATPYWPGRRSSQQTCCSGCTRKFNSGLSRLLHDELHWLDVADRVFKHAVLMYKSLHGTAPLYMMESRTQTADVVSRQHLRSAIQRKIVPCYRLDSYGRRCFAVAGPSTWNSLPDSLRDSALTLSIFRRQLKTHFCEILTRLTQRIRVFTARCTLVQSAVLPSHVVCLSVCL